MTPEDLAELVEDASGASPPIREHLEQCPDCLQMYSQGVVDHLEALDPARVPVDLARVLAGRAIRSGPGPARPHPGPRTRPRSRFRLPALAATGVAAGLVATLLVPHREPQRREFHFSPEVAAVVDGYSASAFVLPGGEHAAANPAPTLRGTESSGSIPASIETAWSRYESDPEQIEPGIEAIAGLLARGNLDLARKRLSSFQKVHAGDPDGLLLEAVVLYQEGGTEAARDVLKHVAGVYPARANLAQLNLGILLKETGRATEAKEIFRGLAAREKDSPLGKRAQREMSL